ESGSCAGSPSRRRSPRRARRRPRRPGAGWPRASLALVAVAVAVSVSPATAAALLGGRRVDVGQQRQLSRALHRAGDLVLVPAASARDPPRADLPLLGDELAQRHDVLVVRLLDLVLAERAGLAPACAGAASLLTPPGGLPAATLLRQRSLVLLVSESVRRCRIAAVSSGGGAAARRPGDGEPGSLRSAATRRVRSPG